jgi:hypothetical protein
MRAVVPRVVGDGLEQCGYDVAVVFVRAVSLATDVQLNLRGLFASARRFLLCLVCAGGVRMANGERARVTRSVS